MYKNPTYTDENNNAISTTLDGVPVCIPVDPANRHFQELLAQLEESGETIAEYVAPPKPFGRLSRAAFLFMAQKLGMGDAEVRAVIASMPDGTEQEQDAKALALLVYENQQDFDRSNALLQQLVDLSPLTDEQVDAAWRQAEALTW